MKKQASDFGNIKNGIQHHIEKITKMQLLQDITCKKQYDREQNFTTYVEKGHKTPTQTKKVQVCAEYNPILSCLNH